MNCSFILLLWFFFYRLKIIIKYLVLDERDRSIKAASDIISCFVILLSIYTSQEKCFRRQCDIVVTLPFLFNNIVNHYMTISAGLRQNDKEMYCVCSTRCYLFSYNIYIRWAARCNFAYNSSSYIFILIILLLLALIFQFYTHRESALVNRIPR